ncbi:putative RNA and SrmB- binding site of polymerase A [Parelusimicrobium proximum]|uniref:hypothetical protein n=1 Tax=Parelusimicrobium proximum TaxID=3228953 RepID=UPI003D1846F1
MTPEDIINILKEIGYAAGSVNAKAWVVGGYVRDYYLGLELNKDIDITIEGDTEAVVDLLAKSWKAEKVKFASFGTFRLVLDNGIKIDFVRARKEIYPCPASLPVVSPSNLRDDLFRRDFTANALACSITKHDFGTDYDYFHSLDAIRGKYIQVLHVKSFEDDPTRLYRAVRFAGRFNWAFEKETDRLMREAVAGEYPLLLSRARVRQELIKILEEKEIERIFKIMDAYDLTKFIYPSLKWTPNLLKTTDPAERIMILALSLEDAGKEFIKCLELKREDSHLITPVLDAVANQKVPLKCFSESQKNVLNICIPSLPQEAMEKCFITGGEIENMGIEKENISSVLSRIQTLQWKGKIKSKKDAEAEVKLLK